MNGIGSSTSQVLNRENSSDAVGDEFEAPFGNKLVIKEHGPPLRLVIPVKYGVKNNKCIGTIRHSSLRPADFCAERGYDWNIGV